MEKIKKGFLIMVLTGILTLLIIPVHAEPVKNEPMTVHHLNEKDNPGTDAERAIAEENLRSGNVHNAVPVIQH